MNKYKYLIKNIGLLTLSNFATKLLSFFLVPLYTSVLSTSEYGTYDLFNTTISLLIPILTIDIQEAVLRFSIDDDSKCRDTISVGIKYLVLSCFLVLIVVLGNNILTVSETLKKYQIEFTVMYILTALSGILMYYCRGIGKIVEVSIASVISSLVMILSNILFLLYFKLDIMGYFWATNLGLASQSIYLIVCLKLWRRLKLFPNKEIQNEMTSYSKPMIANAISWWVNNASDRYVVTYFCGVALNGVYSVSGKIPSIISIFQSIFGQAWTLSAVKDFDPDDNNCFFINVYNIYNSLLVLLCSFLIFLDKPLASFLFAKDFYLAWKYAPFLMISTVFSGMATFIGGLLSAMKKSATFAKTSVITAVLNTILNIILVFFIGPIGAAFSTAFAYGVMWALRLKDIKKSVNLRVNYKRDILAYIILILQAILINIDGITSIFSWYQIAFVIIEIIIFRFEIFKMITKLLSYIKMRLI